jgi:hypothetical protein
MIFITLLSLIANAQVPQAPTPAFEVQSRRLEIFEEPTKQNPLPQGVKRKPATKKFTSAESSVDNESLSMTPNSVGNQSSTPFIEIKATKEKFKGLQRSAILKARINDSITAYEGSKDPVKATITEGPYRGAVLFGFATMDKVTKNVIVAFDTFIPLNSNETFKTLATIKDQDGNSGLVGVLESRYWETFFLQFALNSASAAANATTQYSQTSFGNYNAVPGSDSAIKQGLAGGFNKLAEKVERDSVSKPDYTTVQGPIYVRVYILEQPERN